MAWQHGVAGLSVLEQNPSLTLCLLSIVVKVAAGVAFHAQVWALNSVDCLLDVCCRMTLHCWLRPHSFGGRSNHNSSDHAKGANNAGARFWGIRHLRAACTIHRIFAPTDETQYRGPDIVLIQQQVVLRNADLGSHVSSWKHTNMFVAFDFVWLALRNPE